jgi:hypothetical protein
MWPAVYCILCKLQGFVEEYRDAIPFLGTGIDVL